MILIVSDLTWWEVFVSAWKISKTSYSKGCLIENLRMYISEIFHLLISCLVSLQVPETTERETTDKGGWLQQEKQGKGEGRYGNSLYFLLT